MYDAFSAVFVLLVVLQASRVLWRIGLFALFLSWPILTIYIALIDTRPPGFAGWVRFVVAALGVAIPVALLWVWMRRRVAADKTQADTACREPETSSEDAGSRPAIRLHLIRGTWASGFFAPWIPRRRARAPDWFEEGSAFRCGVLNSLGPSRRVSFTSPSWTQRNSLHARSEAAETFSEFLKVDLEAHRDARHFIVAHSHGGNIAVSALKLLSVEERRRVSGLVTMGTPFLWFECLEVGVVAQVVLFLARLLVPTYIAIGVLAAAFLVGLLPLVEFQLLPGWLNTWPFYVFALVIGLWMVTDDYNKTEETYRLALTSKALQRDDTIPPMLVLRSPDDEASRGMRSGQTTARLLMVVWTLFDTLFTRGKTWWKAALVVVAAPVVGAIQEAGWREASVAAVITALRNPVDVFFQGLMLLYIGGTLGAIAFSTLASVPLAITLGPELLRLPLLVKPVVEDMPTSIRVRAMNLPGSGFRHKVYAHPEAPEQVAAFVSEIAG